MVISGINSIGNISGTNQVDSGQKPESSFTDGFGQVLNKALDDLNQTQSNADDLIGRLAAGDNVDIHDATIALQQADIAFQLALQVRTKIVEAYQEVMRTQV